MSKQLDGPPPIDGEAFLTGRTAERLRAEIRVRFGFREATVADADMLTVWLRDHVAGEAGGEIEPMIERLEARCRELTIEPPSPDRVERIARTALRAHEDRFHNSVYERLSPTTRKRLDALLRPEKDADNDATQDQEDANGSAPAVLLKLRGSPGRPSLASMQDELAKLKLIRQIELPGSLFDRAAPRDLERCRQRVSVEVPRDLRRHPDAALVVTKLDRLARSISDLMRIIQALEQKGAGLRVLNLGMDTGTPTGKLMLTVLGGIAQFEREMMLERQREGVARAKAAGKYKGRKPTPDAIRQEVVRLAGERMTKTAIAGQLNIGEATVYRILAAASKQKILSLEKG